MKKQTMITLALALTLAMPTMPAFAQKAMSKKEIAEKEKAFKNLQHPWKGKKVAYFGDSITDPNIKASKVKYWGFLQDWLGITPYVYGVSGRQWNDIPRQADLLQKEHGDDFDAILIFMGTNDYNMPGDAILDLARELDIVVLKTELEMFTSCGKLYQAGLRGGRAVNG